MNSPQTSEFILKLDSPEATLEMVGGKGASLARMAAGALAERDDVFWLKLDKAEAAARSGSFPVALCRSTSQRTAATHAAAAEVICSNAPAATAFFDTKWPPMPSATAPAAR